jgi:PAS domain S-box-containing protein
MKKHTPKHSEKQDERSIDQDLLQRHYQLILQSAGEGIYGLNTKGHTTFANRAAARMIGWELEELIGKSQHQILHHTKSDGSPYPEEECQIYKAFKDGKVHSVNDEVFWRKDGSCFPVEYTSTPIVDETEKLLGAVVVFRDISQRLKAERKLKNSNTKLRKALSEVEQLKIQLEAENIYLRQEIDYSYNFEEIIGTSKRLKELLSQVEQVAGTDATVLIQGETGTGKELIARAIHSLSKRKNRPLVKVDCGSLPENLLESELFGHEKGAFTGANVKRTGRFELADGGTIFLDEIGELPVKLQPKLLRVLQEGELERIGSTKTIKVSIRVIAATNRVLKDEISAGNFREDLYYRLNVFPVFLPPLRERREDIPLLVEYFINKFEKKLGEKITVVSRKVMEKLMNYHWTGNIRELENVIERAVILSPGNKLILDDSLLEHDETLVNQPITTLNENEREHILKALEYTNWRVSGENGAAKLLGLKRTTLEARMKKLDIRRP